MESLTGGSRPRLATGAAARLSIIDQEMTRGALSGFQLSDITTVRFFRAGQARRAIVASRGRESPVATRKPPERIGNPAESP